MENYNALNNGMYVKHYEEEYNTGKMLFLINNPEKIERDFIETKIEQFNQEKLEHIRKCNLSDDEVYHEIMKTTRVANYILKGFDKTHKKEFDADLKMQLLEFRKKYILKEKNEDSLRLKFYKAKLQNLPTKEFKKEETEIEEKIPFKIALLDELGFFDLPKIKNKSKESQYKIIQKIIEADLRTIKGNVLVLNPESKEDRSKYTSNNHLENTRNYLDKLK
jgi:hypothetical protein